MCTYLGDHLLDHLSHHFPLDFAQQTGLLVGKHLPDLAQNRIGQSAVDQHFTFERVSNFDTRGSLLGILVKASFQQTLQHGRALVGALGQLGAQVVFQEIAQKLQTQTAARPVVEKHVLASHKSDHGDAQRVHVALLAPRLAVDNLWGPVKRNFRK